MKHPINKTTKTLAIALSVCTVFSAVGVAYANVYDDAAAGAVAGKASAEKALAILQGVSTAEPTTAGTAAVAVNPDAPSKDETVYVIANAQGGVQKVIVSDELKNTSKDASINDSSCLSDIKNLKGTENYKKNSDGTMTWDAEGKYIFYQGTTDKTVPVQLTVSYKLDGKDVSAEELAGKSGKVVIRYDYKNDESVTNNTTVPFLALTGMILNNDKFSNITVSNGKIVDDGDSSVVIGFALPGVKECLDLSDDTGEIENYVEISADAKNFSLGSTLTYASCDFVNELDADKIGSVGDLTGQLSQVSSAVSQLTDGSSTLYDGLCTLLEKSGEMSNGIGTLYSGATELSTGLATLDSNSAKLNSGAYQVFATLTSQAQTQLNAGLTANGMSAVTLTPDNYSAVLGGLLDKFSGGAYTQAEAAAKAQIAPLVQAAVLQQVTDGVKETVKAAMIEKGYTADQASTYLISAEGQATVSTYVQAKMASDEIKGTIESNIAAKIASSDVQAQITAAVDNGLAGNASYTAIKSLKTSLDSYAAFYSGLSAYTKGVSSAAGGAAKVAGGLSQLQTGSTSLVSGVTQLRNGAMQLSNGMNEFTSKLSAKLGNLSDSELTTLLPRINTMLDAAKTYKNYSGIADNEAGSVKFIIKTASIGE